MEVPVFNLRNDLQSNLLKRSAFRQSSKVIQTLANIGDLSGHEGCVNAINFNRSGTLLCSGSDDGDVRIWDMNLMECKGALSGHDSNVFATNFLPYRNDSEVISGGNDSDIRHYDLNAGACRVFQHHTRKILKLSVHPWMPDVFLSCSADGTIRQFDVRCKYSNTVTERIQDSQQRRNDNRRVGGGVLRSDDIIPQAFGGGRVRRNNNNNSGGGGAASSAAPVAQMAYLRADAPELDSSLLLNYKLLTSRSDTPTLFGVDHHPDGYRFIVGSSDGSVRLFDSRMIARGGDPRSHVNIYRNVGTKNMFDATGCEFSWDGSEIVATFLGDRVYVFDTETNFEKTFGIDYSNRAASDEDDDTAAFSSKRKRKRRQRPTPPPPPPSVATSTGGPSDNSQPIPKIEKSAAWCLTPDQIVAASVAQCIVANDFFGANERKAEKERQKEKEKEAEMAVESVVLSLSEDTKPKDEETPAEEEVVRDKTPGPVLGSPWPVHSSAFSDFHQHVSLSLDPSPFLSSQPIHVSDSAPEQTVITSPAFDTLPSSVLLSSPTGEEQTVPEETAQQQGQPTSDQQGEEEGIDVTFNPGERFSMRELMRQYLGARRSRFERGEEQTGENENEEGDEEEMAGPPIPARLRQPETHEKDIEEERKEQEDQSPEGHSQHKHARQRRHRSHRSMASDESENERKREKKRRRKEKRRKESESEGIESEKRKKSKEDKREKKRRKRESAEKLPPIPQPRSPPSTSVPNPGDGGGEGSEGTEDEIRLSRQDLSYIWGLIDAPREGESESELAPRGQEAPSQPPTAPTPATSSSSTQPNAADLSPYIRLALSGDQPALMPEPDYPEESDIITEFIFDSESEAEGSSNNDVVGRRRKTYEQVYKGHRSINTIKAAYFYGPRSEFVISGSDDARIFIWEKKSGKLLRVLEGHESVVNSLAFHPHEPLFASSGIDHVVKLWGPQGDFPSPIELAKREKEASRIKEHNEEEINRDGSSTRASCTVM